MFDYESSDIDWFCFINGCPIHVASNGGELPSDLYTAKGFMNAFNAVQAAEPSCEWEINKEFVNSRLDAYNYINGMEKEERDDFLLPNFINRDNYKELSTEQIAYSWSFIEMAKRGFFSFDRVDENRYRLVAFPVFHRTERSSLRSENIYERHGNEFWFEYASRIRPYHFFHHYANPKIISMLRHLVIKEPFSFSLNQDIDLIDIINSLR